MNDRQSTPNRLFKVFIQQYKNEKPNYWKSLKDMKSEQTGFLFVLSLMLSLKSPELYLDIRFICPQLKTGTIYYKGLLTTNQNYLTL